MTLHEGEIGDIAEWFRGPMIAYTFRNKVGFFSLQANFYPMKEPKDDIFNMTD